jgi:membrane-bound metal-dependent hydrolase YbcI (DUF457 family)
LDLDAAGRVFGYGDLAWTGGHRALTHSITFAIVMSLLIATVAFRDVVWNPWRWRLVAYLATGMALHGVLDCFTTYGDGVALLYPWSRSRFTAPWHPFNGVLDEVYLFWPIAIMTIWLGRRRATGSMSRTAPTTNPPT